MNFPPATLSAASAAATSTAGLFAPPAAPVPSAAGDDSDAGNRAGGDTSFATLLGLLVAPPAAAAGSRASGPESCDDDYAYASGLADTTADTGNDDATTAVPDAATLAAQLPFALTGLFVAPPELAPAASESGGAATSPSPDARQRAHVGLQANSLFPISSASSAAIAFATPPAAGGGTVVPSGDGSSEKVAAPVIPLAEDAWTGPQPPSVGQTGEIPAALPDPFHVRGIAPSVSASTAAPASATPDPAQFASPAFTAQSEAVSLQADEGNNMTQPVVAKRSRPTSAAVGIETAKSAASMPADVLSTPAAPAGLSAANAPLSSAAVPSSPAAPVIDPARAVHAVEAVQRVADTAAALADSGGKAVSVSLDFGDEGPLTVQVSLREGAVHAVFRSDSHDVRAALTTAWQQYSARSTNAAVTLADPVFLPLHAAPSPGSGNAGHPPHYQQGPGLQAQADGQSGGGHRQHQPDPRFADRDAPGSFEPEPVPPASVPVTRVRSMIPDTRHLAAIV
ncbi:hypothetical protein OpiT1DRAFT_04910 [Opitutaceae bacterium TAV1]|nr:hypothetical protein OpiT1DRAFT_04910 [Opitutaceae bacterium TAV1]